MHCCVKTLFQFPHKQFLQSNQLCLKENPRFSSERVGASLKEINILHKVYKICRNSNISFVLVRR